MATEQTPGAASESSERARSKDQVAGYVMAGKDIPQEVRDFVAERSASKDADVYPAREGGSYKGPVVMATGVHLVQMVGKDQKNAVVHYRGDVEFVSAKLARQNKQNDLEGRNVQIHYRGSEAKAYTWDAEREKANRAASAEKAEPAKERAAARDRVEQVSQELIEKKIQAFAATLPSAKARDAFIAEMKEVTKKAFEASRPGKEAGIADAARAVSKPQKAKDRNEPEKTPSAQSLER